MCVFSQKQSKHVCLFTALRECFGPAVMHTGVFSPIVCVLRRVFVCICWNVNRFFCYLQLHPICTLLSFLCQCASFIILCAFFLNTRSNLHVQAFMSSRSKVYDREISQCDLFVLVPTHANRQQLSKSTTLSCYRTVTIIFVIRKHVEKRNQEFGCLEKVLFYFDIL